MASPSRVIFYSLASTVLPEAEQVRREALATISNPVRRAAALAIHNFAVSRPAVAARLLGLKYRPDDELDVIGSGYESTVIRLDHSRVYKANWPSVLLGEAALENFVTLKAREHHLMAQYLGEFVLPQHTGRAPHPYIEGRDGLRIEQPYQAISDPQLFRGAASVEEMASNIERLQATVSDAPLALAEFLARGRRLHTDHDLLPDVSGNLNLVVVDGDHLRMIDGQPLNATERAARGDTLQMLALMEAGLQLVHS